MDYLKQFSKILGGVSFGLVLLLTYVIAPALVLSIVLSSASDIGRLSLPTAAQMQSVAFPGVAGIAGALILGLLLDRWNQL